MIFDKAVESELQFCIYIIYCAETLPKRHEFYEIIMISKSFDNVLDLISRGIGSRT